MPEPYRNPVEELQQVLTDAGYDPGPVDGVDGPKTRAAVAQYKAEETRVQAAKEGGVDDLIEVVYG